jgi:hypothetical protein
VFPLAHPFSLPFHLFLLYLRRLSPLYLRFLLLLLSHFPVLFLFVFIFHASCTSFLYSVLLLLLFIFIFQTAPSLCLPFSLLFSSSLYQTSIFLSVSLLLFLLVTCFPPAPLSLLAYRL